MKYTNMNIARSHSYHHNNHSFACLAGLRRGDRPLCHLAACGGASLSRAEAGYVPRASPFERSRYCRLGSLSGRCLSRPCRNTFGPGRPVVGSRRPHLTPWGLPSAWDRLHGPGPRRRRPYPWGPEQPVSGFRRSPSGLWLASVRSGALLTPSVLSLPTLSFFPDLSASCALGDL